MNSYSQSPRVSAPFGRVWERSHSSPSRKRVRNRQSRNATKKQDGEQRPAGSISDRDGQLWKIHCGRQRPQQRGLIDFSLRVRNEDFKSLFKELVFFPQETMTLSLLGTGLDASSTDHPQQSIKETLNNVPNRFWSSTGSEDPESTEFLLYQFLNPICVVRSVRLNIYKAGYQKGLPIYGPRAIQISVGFSPKQEDMHYTSPVFPVNNLDEDQVFLLTPQLVVGGFMRVDLLGKQTTQPGDDLYYLAIRSVKAFGLPVGAVGSPLIYEAVLDYAVSTPCFSTSLIANHEEYKYVGKPSDAMEEEEEDEENEDEKPEEKGKEGYEEDDLSKRLDQMLLRKAAQHFLESKDRHRFLEQLRGILSLQAQGTLDVEKKKLEQKALVRDLIKEETVESYVRVIELVLDSTPEDELRTPEVFGWMTEAKPIPNKSGGKFQLAEQYIFKIAHQAAMRLNEHETLFLIQSSRAFFVPFLLSAEKLTATEKLGDLLATKDLGLATNFYIHAHIPDKVIRCLMELESYELLVRYCTAIHYDADWVGLLKEVKEKKSWRLALQFGLFLSAPPNPAMDIDIVKDVLGIEMEEGEWDIQKRLRSMYEAEVEKHQKEVAEAEQNAKPEEEKKDS